MIVILVVAVMVCTPIILCSIGLGIYFGEPEWIEASCYVNKTKINEYNDKCYKEKCVAYSGEDGSCTQSIKDYYDCYYVKYTVLVNGYIPSEIWSRKYRNEKDAQNAISRHKENNTYACWYTPTKDSDDVSELTWSDKSHVRDADVTASIVLFSISGFCGFIWICICALNVCDYCINRTSIFNCIKQPITYDDDETEVDECDSDSSASVSTSSVYISSD
jgi:hypothetical protein